MKDNWERVSVLNKLNRYLDILRNIMERVESDVFTALHLDIIGIIRLDGSITGLLVSKGGRRNISVYQDGELPPV